MKTYISILLFFIAMFLQAQTGYQNITEKRIEYLSSKLTLTSIEAQQFWPVFREFHKKREAVTAKRENIMDSPDELKDSECLTIVNDYIDVKVRQALLLQEYNIKYLKILPPHKVLELYKFDEEFNKNLLKQIKAAGKRIK